jgi:hypothetical protein
MDKLKIKIIKDNLKLSLLELGSTRFCDLVSETCKEIASNGGAETNLGVFFKPEDWSYDAEEFERMRDAGILKT